MIASNVEVSGAGWPLCEECGYTLGEEERRFCTCCCNSFADCRRAEREARKTGWTPPSVTPTAAPVQESPALAATVSPESEPTARVLPEVVPAPEEKAVPVDSHPREQLGFGFEDPA